MTKVPKQMSLTSVSRFHYWPSFQNKYLKHRFLGSTLDCPQPAWHGWGEDCQWDRRIFQVFVVFLYVRYRPRPTQFLCEGTNLSTRETRGWEQGWLNFYWTTQVDLFSRLPAILTHIFCYLLCWLFSNSNSCVIQYPIYYQTVIPLLSSCMPAILKWW